MPVPLTAPLPVEITNHTESWVQWLPLAASALVAIATLIGVVLSNRTTLRISRQEREDARQRDFVTWRREELRRLGTEVVRDAQFAIDDYSMLSGLLEQPISTTSVEPIDRATRQIGANAEILRFLGAYDAAKHCINVHDLLLDRDLMKAVKVFKSALARDRAAGLPFDSFSDAGKEAESEMEKYLRRVQIALRNFGYAVESELRQLKPPEPQTEPPQVADA